MKLRRIFWICIFVFLILLATKSVSAYCNESINFTDSQNYTITKECTEDYNNFSFLLIGIAFLFGIGLCLWLFFRAEKMPMKVIIALTGSLILMSLMRFLSWFVSITNPAETELVNTMDHYYMFGVWGFRFILIAAAFYVLILTLHLMSDKVKPKDIDWDMFGK